MPIRRAAGGRRRPGLTRRAEPRRRAGLAPGGAVLVLGAEALVESLRRLGATPVVARDGAGARALLAEGAWALLLCRWPGEGVGTAALLEALRREGRVPGLPVLAVLDRPDPRAIVAAAHAGASACVIEPVTDPELRARLELALGRRPGGG